MPTKVSFVLYISCIAISIVRLSQAMTKMSPGQIKANLDLAIRQDWIDKLTRELLQECHGAFPDTEV